jgi:hypothetical protein
MKHNTRSAPVQLGGRNKCKWWEKYVAATVLLDLSWVWQLVFNIGCSNSSNALFPAHSHPQSKHPHHSTAVFPNNAQSHVPFLWPSRIVGYKSSTAPPNSTESAPRPSSMSNATYQLPFDFYLCASVATNGICSSYGSCNKMHIKLV